MVHTTVGATSFQPLGTVGNQIRTTVDKVDVTRRDESESTDREDSDSDTNTDSLSVYGPSNLLEEIQISPLERWKKFHVFPKRLFVQVIVLLSLLAYVYFLCFVNLKFSINSQRTLFHLLFKNSVSSQHELQSYTSTNPFDGDFYYEEYKFLEISKPVCAKHISRIIKNYFELQTNSADRIITDSTNVPLPRIQYVLTVSKLHSAIISNNWTT